MAREGTNRRVGAENMGSLSLLLVLGAIISLPIILDPCLAQHQQQHLVGGSNGWRLDSGLINYQEWANSNTFYLGDTLLFKGSYFQVVELSKTSYASCNMDQVDSQYLITENTSGGTIVKLTRIGTHYFSSNVEVQCKYGMKFTINVKPTLNDKNSKFPYEFPPMDEPPTTSMYPPPLVEDPYYSPPITNDPTPTSNIMSPPPPTPLIEEPPPPPNNIVPTPSNTITYPPPPYVYPTTSPIPYTPPSSIITYPPPPLNSPSGNNPSIGSSSYPPGNYPSPTNPSIVNNQNPLSTSFPLYSPYGTYNNNNNNNNPNPNNNINNNNDNNINNSMAASTIPRFTMTLINIIGAIFYVLCLMY